MVSLACIYFLANKAILDELFGISSQTWLVEEHDYLGHGGFQAKVFSCWGVMKFVDDAIAEIVSLGKKNSVAEEEQSLSCGELISQWLVVGVRLVSFCGGEVLLQFLENGGKRGGDD